MKVKATKLGYHDHRRRYPGDVFVLRARKKNDGTVLSPEQQFSKNWMEKVDVATPEKSVPKTVIEPGKLDEVRERNQPTHKSIEEHQAELAQKAAAKTPTETEAPETETEAPAGQSSGDSEVI